MILCYNIYKWGENMKISFGSDHGGLELKNHLLSYLKTKGYEVIDFGTKISDSCDYPDYAYPAAKSLSLGEVDYAIVICTTGIGVSIVANNTFLSGLISLVPLTLSTL